MECIHSDGKRWGAWRPFSQTPAEKPEAVYVRYIECVHPIDLLRFFALLFAGALAGFEIGVHYGIGAPPSSLPENAQIMLRQAMVLRLRVLAPAIFFPALALVLALLVRDGGAPGVWLRRAAVGALGLWIVFRVIRTVPVNSASLTWHPEAPPKNWRELIAQTESAHVFAAWAAVLAFACLLAASLPTQ